MSIVSNLVQERNGLCEPKFAERTEDRRGHARQGGGNAACYAVGLLRRVTMGREIVAYLEGIDATLAPFRGRFIIHGGPCHRLEGAPPGDLIVIEFPSLSAARDWYASPAYAAILPLRLRNADGDVFLVEGVSADHIATDVLAGRPGEGSEGASGDKGTRI